MKVDYSPSVLDELDVVESIILFIGDIYGLDATITVDIEENFEYEACVEVVDLENGEYKLTIDPILFEDEKVLLTTIAHEMIHVKQYEYGQLVASEEADKNIFIWNGDEYDWTGGVARSTYFSAPWEVEAYGMERALYELWLENEDMKNNLKKMLDNC